MSREWVWQWNQTCSVCFSKLSSQTSIQLQLKSLIDRCFWLDTIWTVVTGSCVTSWSYIPSCYTRDGFYVWSYDKEPSGSFWQLQGDTIGGPIFHEILSWGSRRNKSLDCTLSSLLCQTYALRISGVAAQLKNSAKQFRAAETQSPNGTMPYLHTLPARMLCLQSSGEEYSTSASGAHRVVHLHKSRFCCCSGMFFCISQLFFPVVFALPSCIPFFLLWSLKVELDKRGDADARLEAQYLWVRWQDKMRWLFSLQAPGTPPRVAYLRPKSAPAELYLQP